MGQLFWKYFIAFVLTQLATLMAVGITLHLHGYANLGLVANQLLAHTFQQAAILNVILVCLLFLILISLCMAWVLTRPIQRLSKAIQSAAKGDFTKLVGNNRISINHVLTKHGLDVLSQSFIDLIDRLQQLLMGQTRMLHHVSHELRTPLARMQMATGLAIQNHKKVESALKRIELESIRMDSMITELLEVSRLESGMLKLNKKAVDICEVLSNIVTDVEFEQASIKIDLKLPQQCQPKQAVYLDGQFDLLYRAIENVVRNAVKYSPEHSAVQIDLQLSNKTKEMVIEVQDHGQGVAEDELETIFLPFVRAKNSSLKEGHGVGLAITKHIVEAHGGYVSAVNLNPSGFMVRLHFPL